MKRPRPKEWDSETVMKAVKMRFTCTSSGYQTMVDDGYPGPSIRTVQARTEHIKCNPGLEKETLETLKIKAGTFAVPADRCCLLFNDEMKITSGQQFNPSTNCIVGNATLPPHENEQGDKAMVWMLAGENKVFQHFKLAIFSYYFYFINSA